MVGGSAEPTNRCITGVVRHQGPTSVSEVYKRKDVTKKTRRATVMLILLMDSMVEILYIKIICQLWNSILATLGQLMTTRLANIKWANWNVRETVSI